MQRGSRVDFGLRSERAFMSGTVLNIGEHGMLFGVPGEGGKDSWVFVPYANLGWVKERSRRKAKKADK